MNLVLHADDPNLPRLNEVVALLGGRVVDGRLDTCDACLVWGNRESAAVVSEKIAHGPVWLVPQALMGSDVVYGLIPLDEERPCQLKAVWPQRLFPAVQELKHLIQEQGMGQTLHLQMERIVTTGAALSSEQIEAAWLHDADLLRSLCGGEYRRVTAIHSGLTPLGISTASVSLSGDSVPDAMWALRAGAAARCELTVTTASGAAVLAWEDGEPTLTVNCKSVALRTKCEVPLTPSHGGSGEQEPLSVGVLPWSDAVRAFDLLDAARRSLKRRRTVELQFESTSERSQFKTHMTTIGCGLLLFTMFGLMGLLFAGRMLDPRDAQQKQSEVAGFVLTDADFEGAALNSLGREKLTEIIENYPRRSATVLVEGPSDAPPSERRTTVVQSLTEAGLSGAETRTLMRPLQGQWFKRLMITAWFLLFLPLGIFLGIQMLLGVTPEDRSRPRVNP